MRHAAIHVALVAGCAAAPQPSSAPAVQRYGSVIGLREEKIDEYRKLHAAAWPGILKILRECNIRNYSIYLRRLDDGRPYLFSYFEYAGTDFAADVKKIASDPLTQEWWKLTDPCQRPLDSRKEGEWWSGMEEVFHMD
jgi:L-rhamnose mutarotase